MTDEQLVDRLDRIVAEEREIRDQAGSDGVDASGQARLHALDQEREVIEDLRRRRRAEAAAGGDPNQVQARPVDEIEHYLQ